jgi:hypothetical protein
MLFNSMLFNGASNHLTVFLSLTQPGLLDQLLYAGKIAEQPPI